MKLKNIINKYVYNVKLSEIIYQINYKYFNSYNIIN